MSATEPSRAPVHPAPAGSLLGLDQVLSDDALLDVIGTASLCDAEPNLGRATDGEDPGRGDMLLVSTLMEWRRYLES